MNEADHRHLRRAIELAIAARQAGDMPFGALLVDRAGQVLAEDRNTVVTERDVSGHPELKLARWAGRELDRRTTLETSMYTSCEPCAMCKGAIARAGLGRVVFALAGDQLHDLKPPGAVAPDYIRVHYEGEGHGNQDSIRDQVFLRVRPRPAPPPRPRWGIQTVLGARRLIS
jgi:tRNA(Arg) A34 adenosine deaminase TadA